MACLEDVLQLYEQAYDARYPLVCFDERPCQLLAHTAAPLPLQAGHGVRQDYEYVRQGTACLLVAFVPGISQRFVWTREHRTALDYAEFMQYLSQQLPDAVKIRVVQDNLNTHQPASFYKAFAAADAFALAQRFEWHYTPKKASWLNMCEFELAALTKQCLDRRLSDIQTLDAEVQQVVKERNARNAKVNWLFTNSKARTKFARFYKLINSNN